jgi:hypothetical protein
VVLIAELAVDAPDCQQVFRLSRGRAGCQHHRSRCRSAAEPAGACLCAAPAPSWANYHQEPLRDPESDPIPTRGVDRDLGSVEAGKIAALVVVRGKPAANPADIRNVVHVFKDGVGYDPVKLIDSVKGVVGIR